MNHPIKDLELFYTQLHNYMHLLTYIHLRTQSCVIIYVSHLLPPSLPLSLFLHLPLSHMQSITLVQEICKIHSYIYMISCNHQDIECMYYQHKQIIQLTTQLPLETEKISICMYIYLRMQLFSNVAMESHQLFYLVSDHKTLLSSIYIRFKHVCCMSFSMITYSQDYVHT